MCSIRCKAVHTTVTPARRLIESKHVFRGRVKYRVAFSCKPEPSFPVLQHTVYRYLGQVTFFVAEIILAHIINSAQQSSDPQVAVVILVDPVDHCRKTLYLVFMLSFYYVKLVGIRE